MKKLKWTIEIEVCESWIADGFNLQSDDDVIDLLKKRLPYAYGHDLSGKILLSPDIQTINELQGRE